MKQKSTVLTVLLFLLSACAAAEDTPEANVETAEPATSPEPSTPQIETATPTTAPTDTPLPPTEAAPATESQPAPTETAAPTEPAPTPVTPFTTESIRPGQQEAYSYLSSSGEELQYWLYLPADYDGGQTWPLIVSLHGTLGFEPSLERVRGQSPLAYIDPDVVLPFIVISPLTPSASWELYHQTMEELIEHLGESLSIDTEAQFLIGLSTGSIGAWQWALAFPYFYDGVAMIAGSPSINPNDPVPENICVIKDLPIWIANSETDERVPIEQHRAAILALEACGSTATHFTAFPDLNHVEIVNTAYGDPELYNWMLTLIDEGS